MAETNGSIATDGQVLARPPADSEYSKDDLKLGGFGQADFGLGDPGVVVISSDQGGDINRYERKYFGAANDNIRWVVDGDCNSACTMVLGTGRICATPRAQFGFHAGYTYYAFFKVVVPRFTYQMYRHYPDDVKDWVDRKHAMDQVAMTMMRQPEVSTYVPAAEPD